MLRSRQPAGSDTSHPHTLPPPRPNVQFLAAAVNVAPATADDPERGRIGRPHANVVPAFPMGADKSKRDGAAVRGKKDVPRPAVAVTGPSLSQGRLGALLENWDVDLVAL